MQSEVEKAIKEMSDKTATGHDDVPGMYSNYWEMMVSE
jgi:hypothetical protein